MKEIILSADSTCDLPDQLKARYGIYIQPLTIILKDKHYRDGVDITPDNIYAAYKSEKVLPKTSAPNPMEYYRHFKKWTDEGHDVIHISLGSSISSSFQNACIAATEFDNVYVIDSGNLSAGSGLLVIEAAERIAAEMDATQIYDEICALRSHINVSFILNNLTYLHSGGRCSALQSIGASTFNIRPTIEVDNKDATMSVGKKYRGSMAKVIRNYTIDRLANREDLRLNRIFLVHSGTDPANIQLVKETIKEVAGFHEILIARAGCTISSHCGPDTLSIMFMTK